ncbi:GNAT family N-acetyltransferase [Phenylobacterium terrae]|uniref:GNAT family N-acetyltransferase n=1 Tax=Phenylobacterium terrae TaxID=2665495 RepID=A0ABW4N6P4_9CAUL
MTTDIPPAPVPPFRTERLILRDFREDDFDDIHAYAVDPDVVRYMDWGPNTPEVTREYLGRALAGQAERPPHAVNVAVELAAEGRVIGSMRLEVKDAANRTADIGYSIHRPYWGQGLVAEGARRLLAIAFEDMKLHRVWATCDARNRGSWRVMEKLGMRREGVLKKANLRRDGWQDTLLYAVLAEEWAGLPNG